MDQDSLFNNSPIGIGTIKNRIITSINNRACEVIGYDKKELIGQSTRILYFNAKEYDRVGDILYPMLDEKGIGEVQTRFRHKNGQILDVWLRVAWLDNDDHCQGHIFTTLNFTEQNKARHALLESEERFLTAGRFAHFGVWELDIDNNQIISDGTYRDLMGFSLDDQFSTADHWLQSILSHDDRRAANILLKKLARNKIDELHLEHAAIKKDGTRIQAELQAQIINKDNRRHLIGYSRDITEYRQVRETLKSQTQLYSTLVESTSAVLFIANADSWQFEFINNEVETLLGYPANRWTSERDFWLNHIHPDDRAWVTENCLDAIQHKQSRTAEYRFIAADDSIVWLQDQTSVVVENDQVIKLVGVLIDITEIKQNEKSLRSLSQVVEQSQDAILLTDENLKITYLNAAFIQLYGYTLNEIKGRIPDFIYAEEHAKDYQLTLYKKIRRGENVYDVALNRRKDGSTFICQFWVSSLRDDRKKITGYVGSLRDITSVVKQEQSLRESEARYRMLYEEIPEGVVLFNADGEVITANPAARDILGYQRREDMHLRCMNKFYPCLREDGSDIPPEAHPAFIALQTGNPIRNYVMGVYNPEKRDTVWINIDAIPLFDNSPARPDRVFTSFSNTTEARKLQQELIKTQRMQAVGQLTGGIAHDFNNILGSILGFTELAKLNFAGDHEKLDNYLEQIETAGQRARDLIRELLVFSRGESTSGATPQQIAPQIQQIITLLRPMLTSGIHLQTDIEEPGPTVKIDPLHLQQLLMNLSINAREAMQNMGNLTISVKSVNIDNSLCDLCQQPVRGHWAEISVADTGSGIDPAIRADMFQPFISTKDFGEGSGMGLAVVKGIIETYHGHIHVNTSPEGAHFQLLLPESVIE